MIQFILGILVGAVLGVVLGGLAGGIVGFGVCAACRAAGVDETAQPLCEDETGEKNAAND